MVSIVSDIVIMMASERNIFSLFYTWKYNNNLAIIDWDLKINPRIWKKAIDLELVDYGKLNRYVPFSPRFHWKNGKEAPKDY